MKTVFVVANIPKEGTHLIESLTGVYSTEEQALKNIKDDGDIIIPLQLDKDDDGKDVITGWYPRLEVKEKDSKELRKAIKEETKILKGIEIDNEVQIHN